MNITGDRSRFNVMVKFFDKPNENMNILDCASQTKMFRRSSSDNFAGELYKAIMERVYGATNLSHYSSSENPQSDHVSAYDVIQAIEKLILNGYVSSTTSALDFKLIENWIGKSVKKRNSYIFSNDRRKTTTPNLPRSNPATLKTTHNRNDESETPRRLKKPRRLRIVESSNDENDYNCSKISLFLFFVFKFNNERWCSFYTKKTFFIFHFIKL